MRVEFVVQKTKTMAVKTLKCSIEMRGTAGLFSLSLSVQTPLSHFSVIQIMVNLKILINNQGSTNRTCWIRISLNTNLMKCIFHGKALVFFNTKDNTILFVWLNHGRIIIIYSSFERPFFHYVLLVLSVQVSVSEWCDFCTSFRKSRHFCSPHKEI